MSKDKILTTADIKKALKFRSKGELVEIIVGLSNRIDGAKEILKDAKEKIIDINSYTGFKYDLDYETLFGKVDKDV